jgi:hypothetical protein
MLLLLILLCLSCVALIGWGFTGPNRCLRFASLIGASVAGFILPQVFGAFNSGRLHNFDGGLEMFVLMAVLCMAMALAGDLWGYNRSHGKLRRLADYDWRRVTEAALILNAVAIFAALMNVVVFNEEIARRTHFVGGMSGAGVAVLFFATVHRYGFALALLLYWERRSILSLAMVLFGAVNYLYIIFALSRRGPAIEFVFILLITYALGRRKHIPALLIALLFVVGTFWSTAIAEFRTRGEFSVSETMDKFETADFIGSFTNVIEHGGLEVANGVEVITTTYENQAYEYGKLHWNRLVHAYFPAQIFGAETKQGLKFDLDDIAEQANLRRGTLGATPTGMADCFTSFGFFGCLKYLAIGFVMGRWYRRAFQGDLAAQLAFSTLMSGALHTISHGTAWLLNEYIHFALFSYPVLYWARKPARMTGGLARRVPGHYGREAALDGAPGLR